MGRFVDIDRVLLETRDIDTEAEKPHERRA